ncbi:hypothetical protein Sm713_59360 [Streptomyces sp. TS71-3]|nr:hypothetical protein Sm713_59360 [Streptomyces sp. TS71-3]
MVDQEETASECVRPLRGSHPYGAVAARVAYLDPEDLLGEDEPYLEEAVVDAAVQQGVGGQFADDERGVLRV